MPNRLADATSPYLLQHADNPVDWFEWGTGAFEKAVERDVPVLLSIGYSACHWCHVMAHESFEDEAIASYMNDHFVNVKVDREERPDVDQVYMDAVTAMTGRGGWPMTVFLTPDGRPIHAGTYYPKTAIGGHPSFGDVMAAIVDAWRNNRDGAISQAATITDAINRALPAAGPQPTVEDTAEAVRAIERSFDTTNGGFGGAPKFPQAPTLEFLLRYAALRPNTEEAATALLMLTTTLEHMARGGIYDHIYGGFARYSVDRIWLVPHFEKMLYDNALLARIYLRTWQLTGDDRFRTTAREVLDYLDTTMVDTSGGIHAAQDADSEGVEGKFAVWTWEELETILGADLPVAAAIYGFTEDGNFEGANIPTRTSDLMSVARQHDLDEVGMAQVRERIDVALRRVRSQRVPPGRDDKMVSAWNGFALRAFAEAAAVLQEPRYTDRAKAIATFLTTDASPQGNLARSWRGGAGVDAFADDLGAVAVGLYMLFEVTGEAPWFEHAEACVDRLRTAFADPAGGFFSTADDAEKLIARPKSLQDNPTPSDNSLAMEALQFHAAFTGDQTAIAEMEQTMASISVIANRHPSFAGHALAVWVTHLVGVKEVAITGVKDATSELVSEIWETYRPDVVLALNRGTDSNVPLLADRPAGQEATAFVCQDLICELPVHTRDELRSLLEN